VVADREDGFNKILFHMGEIKTCFKVDRKDNGGK
jgi:hypothetical protein